MVGIAQGKKRLGAWLHAAAALAVVLIAATALASGLTILPPGGEGKAATGFRGQYTTITITNTGSQPAMVLITAPFSRSIQLPPNGSVELYENFGGATLTFRNEGAAPVRVLTRYLEVPTFTP